MNAGEFVDRWHRRATECSDCFDQFFSAWIAFVLRRDDISMSSSLQDRTQIENQLFNNSPSELVRLLLRYGS
jgi:hypothetical protein